MWIFRELARFVVRVGAAVLIAIVIAELRAIVSGGDTFHTFRIVLFLMGGFFLLLGGAGTGSAASRRVNWGTITPGLGGVIFRSIQPKPEDPKLTATAVFISTAVVLLVLGALM
jgi:hypothetical protein